VLKFVTEILDIVHYFRPKIPLWYGGWICLCLRRDWERESDEHVQNLSQLYPFHVTLGVVGVIRLKTLFSFLGAQMQ